MSLEKAIEHGKEHRKPYHVDRRNFAKSISRQCRNHGSCIWCKGNRKYSSKKRLESSKDKEEMV